MFHLVFVHVYSVYNHLEEDICVLYKAYIMFQDHIYLLLKGCIRTVSNFMRACPLKQLNCYICTCPHPSIQTCDKFPG